MDKSIRLNAMMWIVAGTVVAAGCGGNDSTPNAEATGDDSTTTTADATGSMASATGPGPTSNADSTAGPASTGMDDASFFDPGGSSEESGPVMPQPNGGSCAGADECVSGFCFEIPTQGGVCSECVVDQDCPMGTCAIDAAGYAVCTDGSLGVMCGTDEGCMGDFVCSELIDTGGIFPLNFCSECRIDDVPCPGTQICSPVLDAVSVGGYMGCVEPGSVPNGGGCSVDAGVGDGTVCESTLCGVATLGGVIPIGICGECLTDEDCVAAGLTTCQPAAVDMTTGLQAATCI